MFPGNKDHIMDSLKQLLLILAPWLHWGGGFPILFKTTKSHPKDEVKTEESPQNSRVVKAEIAVARWTMIGVLVSAFLAVVIPVFVWLFALQNNVSALQVKVDSLNENGSRGTQADIAALKAEVGILKTNCASVQSALSVVAGLESVAKENNHDVHALEDRVGRLERERRSK